MSYTDETLKHYGIEKQASGPEPQKWILTNLIERGGTWKLEFNGVEWTAPVEEVSDVVAELGTIARNLDKSGKDMLKYVLQSQIAKGAKGRDLNPKFSVEIPNEKEAQVTFKTPNGQYKLLSSGWVLLITVSPNVSPNEMMEVIVAALRLLGRRLQVAPTAQKAISGLSW